MSKVTYDDDQLVIELSVKDYKPEDISITNEGDTLTITGKGTNIQFEQKFTLPSGVVVDRIRSSLSRDGVLKVTAPRETTSLKKGAQAEMSPEVKYDDDKFQITMDCSNYVNPEIKVLGNSILIKAKEEIKEAGGTRTKIMEQKFTLPAGMNADKVSSKLSPAGILVITAPRSLEQKLEKTLSTSRWSTSNQQNEMMAVEDNVYKISIDVQGFQPEDLVIKSVGKSVHVEAKKEASQGSSFSSNSFSRTYTLPNTVDPEGITSKMDKHGILTLSIPIINSGKKPSRIVPIKHL